MEMTVIPMARLPAHSPASRTRRQRELLELAEITSSDVVFWDGGPRAPPTHQPQPDPDTNQDSEVREALSPSLSPNHTGSRYPSGSQGAILQEAGYRTERVPEPIPVQQMYIKLI